MRKQKYFFDNSTLEYRLFEKDFKKKVTKFLFYFIGSIALSALYIGIFLHFFDSPEEKSLKRENNELVLNYQLLDRKIADVDYRLNSIQNNDDKIYRPIFEIEPISGAIRNAGYGGVNRYEVFESWRNGEMVINTSSSIDRIAKKLYVQSKSYDEISYLALNKEKFLDARPAIMPVSPGEYYRISDYFGVRKDPFTGRKKEHHGIDFAGRKGLSIYVAGDGVIEKVKYGRFGYGREIVVNHGFGYKTRYAHLQKWLVEEGQVVKRGEVIGLLGSSGRSTGPHLHYEVIYKGKKINPLNYFNRDVTGEEFERIVSRDELMVNNN